MSLAAKQVAFVTGANGVTGQYLVSQLAREPKWSRIIATSRHPPYNLPQSARVTFHKYDLNKDVDTVMEALEAMGATRVTHFFHMAYIHHDSFEKQYEYNVPFFENILTAVETLNGDTLQRVVLQTGAKHYGQAYKAPPRQPITEDLGRLGLDGPPNFYYPQEDFMFELQKGKRWTWSVTRPFLISGVSAGSGQSFTCTAAIYFTIQKALDEPAVFPVPTDGDNCYAKRQDFSSASNIAAFTSYLATHAGGANQAYNIVDNDASETTFADLWEYMGSYFGVSVTTRPGFDLARDIEDKLKAGVWGQIVDRYGGDKDACERFATWRFFAWAMGNAPWGSHVSMDKAGREIGWTVQWDTRQDIKRVFDTMRKEGIIPTI
ncbi:uncharacterized protein A1O5_12716 [Cladophialophora psammophila CBS 110553]|uniref:PRISE-like Rossmann-fold domain-containing protein n=1 Tax=Cladophialophora psammophila CBS 110553 TaxID=1182543 RepID=W9VT91_9EURO|nr:uncharacterized protein A1O5_12716 [Cladophialophora psammophila CBS 110553]EXJ56260.1 hypothetical protein A1O5_12716 [Cladophialophora psammophila CBS 110553]